MTETALASRATELRRAFDHSFAVPADDNRHEKVDLLDIMLAGQPYAIRTAEIAGIHLDLEVSHVPGPLPELVGITAIRGALLPVYDLGIVLGVGPSAGRWVVLDATRTVGLSFSDFHGHARIDAGQLAAHASGQQIASHVARIGDAARPVISIPSLIESIRQRVERAGTHRG